MREITDYLFVDRRRLDSYFEQLGSSIKMVKLPAWKVAFGLAGPTVEAAQSTSVQSFSSHEKLQTLMTKLKPHRGQLAAFNGEDEEFVFETLDATRVLIPAGITNKKELPSVALWLCTRSDAEDQYQGFRYLVEDFQAEDLPRMRSSGFSIARAILKELEGQLAGSTLSGFPDVHEKVVTLDLKPDVLKYLNSKFIDSFGGSWKEQRAAYQADKEETLRDVLGSAGLTEYASYEIRYLGVDGSYARDHCFELLHGDKIFSARTSERNDKAAGGGATIKIQRDRRNELEHRFTHEPARLLEELGAVVSPKRKIDSLYRIRHSGETRSGLTLVGYPIFVAASPSAFKSNE